MVSEGEDLGKYGAFMKVSGNGDVHAEQLSHLILQRAEASSATLQSNCS